MVKKNHTKKNFYKGPSFIFSLVLHLAIVAVVFLSVSPFLFVRPKEKKIVTVDIVNEKDINQKLPDPATLGRKQIAKPKPIGGKIVNDAKTISKKQNLAGLTPSSRVKRNDSPPPKTSKAASTQKRPQPPRTKISKSDSNVPKILKTVDKIRATPKNKGKTTSNQSPYASKKQSVITSNKINIGAKDALSQDEFLSLRRQIVNCWQIPAGLRDIDKTTITVLLTLSPNGVIKNTSLKDPKLLEKDTTRVLAESALRSFATPACKRLKLPKEKYIYWKKIEFVFDPYYAL